jgi:hypothetical protein
METAHSSEVPLNICQTTQCHNPEDSNLHNHPSENFKANTIQNSGIYLNEPYSGVVLGRVVEAIRNSPHGH